MSQPRPLKVVFIAAHDAYQKGARNICRLLKQQTRVEVSWFTTSSRLVTPGLNWLEINQVARNETLQQADLIFAGLGGRDLNKLISGLRGPQASALREGFGPRIIGYFPGVLHLRIFESLATRLLCDQVWLNCERDYQLYRKLALATIGEDNGVLFGAPWIGAAPEPVQQCDIDLLFVEQSVVPENLSDRTRLVKLLVDLARQHPDWCIVVALRVRKGKASSHQLEHCLEEISQRQDNGSVKLAFVLDDIDQLTARAQRVATISSSVAYTSLAWGKPTLFINDLGVRQDWGNDLFKHSGYMASLQAAADQNFSDSRWGQQFIQLPRPEVIAVLCQPSQSSAKRVLLPSIPVANLKVLGLMLSFCLKHLKNPFVEFNGLNRTIRNINNRIYKSCNTCSGQVKLDTKM